MIARAFWNLCQFSKRVNFKNAVMFFARRRGSAQRPDAAHVVSLPITYWCSMFTVWQLVCTYISYFQSLMDVQPLWRLMCTNKTCCAGVGTRPKTIFRISICFLSYPCESRKIQIFLSADQTSIPGVNQVFPVLEWNLIFVLLSKILDRFKRSFVVRIPQVTDYREMQNMHVKQLFVGTVTKSKWEGLVWKLKNRYRQKL